MLDFEIVKVCVAYIAVTAGPITADYCARFVGTYCEYPAMIEHELIVCCNGGPLKQDLALLFLPVKCEFLPRVNDQGWDISAYQDVAQRTDAEFLVCLGESIWFHREGWLMRLVAARMAHGPGIYGCYASYLVRPHLNTTAFALDTKFLRAYPKVKDHKGRYDFEHGRNSIWHKVEQMRGVAKLVTWDGVWSMPQWRTPQNILWRGDQSNCLVFCNHTDRYAGLTDSGKRNWEGGADTLRPDNRVPALEPWRR